MLRVQTEDGAVRLQAPTNQTQLALHLSGNFIVSLSATHATVVSSLLTAAPLRAVPCTGLDGAQMASAVFDASRAHRAFAISPQGELLTLTVPHESRLGVCKVHMCKQLPLPLGPVALASLKGYLVVSHAAGSAFLNTTSVVSRNPQELAAESSTNLAALVGLDFGSDQIHSPVVATAPSSLLALALGSGVVLLFEAHLPQPPLPTSTAASYTQPAFIAAMLVVGAWQFYRLRGKAQGTGQPYSSSAYRDTIRALKVCRGGRGRGVLGLGFEPDADQEQDARAFPASRPATGVRKVLKPLR
ncbi:MAG: hypothetical protein WDW36_003665 [Sanguina aurantia]